MSNTLKKSLLGSMAFGAMVAMAAGSDYSYSAFGRPSRRGGSNTVVLKHSVSGGDHSHLLNQPKKLKKGSGAKKLTRAERKRARYMRKKHG